MQTAAVIAEYNPFHNGHAYQLTQLRLAGATHIVVVMSGNFVQRGGPAIFEKRLRAAAALHNGADLILELPLPYAMATAERFAFGAVSLVAACGCVDLLYFGSECGSLPLLEQTAQALENPRLPNLMAPYLAQGLPFAAARSRALGQGFSPALAQVLEGPNNTLAVEYLRQLHRAGAAIQAATLRRQGADHHSSGTCQGFASATWLRERLTLGEEILPFVPSSAAQLYAQAAIASPALGERAVLARLRSLSAQEYTSLPDLSEGIECRLKNAVAGAASLEEVFTLAKTKRYPLARLRRLAFSAYLGLDGSLCRQSPPYLRVLGHNQRGREVLAQMRSSAALPVCASLAKLEKTSPLCRAFAQAEGSSCDLYNLFQPHLRPCGWDYTEGPVIL